jgi:hypothetical protein
MRWVTRDNAKVDRIACPWLIRKFVDSDAEFVFLPHDTNWSAITDGTVFDVPNTELGHHGEYCSFDAIITRYGLDKDPALVELGKIVRAADTPRKDWAPEGSVWRRLRTASDSPARTISVRTRSTNCSQKWHLSIPITDSVAHSVALRRHSINRRAAPCVSRR